MTNQSGFTPYTGYAPHMLGDPAFFPVEEVTKSEHAFYTKLIEYEIDEIKPQISEKGIDYPALSPFKGTYLLKNMIKTLESLATKRWIKRAGSETILECSDCDSTHVHAKGYCVKCESGKIHNETIVEHKLCGFKGFKRYFARGVDKVCPKCDRVVNERDIRLLGTLFVCDTCKARFDEPLIGFTCTNCGNEFDTSQAKYLVATSYSVIVTDRKPQIIKRPVIRKTPIIEQDYPDQNDALWADTPLKSNYNLSKPSHKPAVKSTLKLPFDLDEPDDYSEEDVLYPLNDDYMNKSSADLTVQEMENPVPEEKTQESTPPKVIEPIKVVEKKSEKMIKLLQEKQSAKKPIKKTQSSTLMSLSDDHTLVENIYKVFKEKAKGHDIKIIHHLESRQLFRSLRRKSDLILIDSDMQDVNIKEICDETGKWGIKTPIMLLSNNQKRDQKQYSALKINQVLPKTQKGFHKILDSLIH